MLERTNLRRKPIMIVAAERKGIRESCGAGPRQQTRLLLVDDHAAVRAGVCDLLSGEPDFEVVAAVATAEEALEVANREVIDLAIVDYQLGSRSGLWLSRKLKRLPRSPRVVIYSAYADDVLSAASVIAEADGIVNKSGLGSELREAVREVARGGHRLGPVPPWLSEALRHRLGHPEQAIFGMLLAGIRREEIAQTLGMSADELDSRLWAMLGALDRAGATRAR
jgi:DNA-binding NarL/FixJ family response regulator